MKPSENIRWLPLAASMLMLSACTLNVDGLGDDGETTPTPDPTTNPTTDPSGNPTTNPTTDPTAVPNLNLVLNGVVAQGVSGSGAVANSEVVINVDDDNGSSQITTTTDEDGRYTVVINDVGNENGDASISIATNSEGYTQGSRSISSLASGGDLTLDANIIVAPESIEVAAVIADTILSFGQLFGLAETKLAPVGPDSVYANDGEEDHPSVSIDIPSAWLTGVDVVVAGYKGFNPNVSSQIQAYPGNFTGIGAINAAATDVQIAKPATTVGVVPNRLINSVFAQVKLRDENNSRITLTPDSSDPFIVNIELPQASYASVQDDVNPTLAGIQVPVYSYDQRWYYVGNATLVTEDTNNAGELVTWSGNVTTINEATNDLGIYAQLSISSVQSWMPWLAISWPIVDVSANVCIDELVQFTQLPQAVLTQLGVNAKAQLFNGYAELALPDGSFDWVFISEGQLHYQGAVSRDGNVELAIYNPLIQQYDRFDAAFNREAAVDGCVSVSFSFAGQIELDNPLSCAVTGQLSDASGNGLPSRPVQLSGEGYNRLAITNATGHFAVPVVCDTDITVKASLGGTVNAKVINANGTTDNDEASDTAIYADESNAISLGSVVEVDFTVPNVAPVILGVDFQQIVVHDLVQPETVITVSASTYDPDGDDVTVTISCSKDEVEAANFTPTSDTCSVNSEGLHKIDVSATDGTNEPVTATRYFQVITTDSNRAPLFLGLKANDVALGCIREKPGIFSCKTTVIEGAVINLKADAFDPDGNDLTWAWSNSDATSTTSFDSSVATSPLVLTVSDGQAQLQVTLEVVIKALPKPVINYMFVNPVEVPVNSSGTNAIAIKAEAYASNPAIADPSIGYNWVLEFLDTESETGGLVDISDLLTDATVEGELGSQISIAPNTLESGVYELTLNVSDDRANEVSKAIVFKVLHSNNTGDPSISNPVIIIE